MTPQTTQRRIAKNTLLLYVRQALVLFVSLYTVRAVLGALGVEDFGIYNVIGGIVSFFSFLSGTMASATQRYFSFALGENDGAKLQKIFVVNGLIYVAIAVAAFILLETVGLWFVNNQLNIPVARTAAVQWVYQCSILTFISTILTTPFMAIIIAHEDMKFYAYVSIIEAAMKLAIVFPLAFLPWDKLEFYAAMILAASTITVAIYTTFCVRRYKECQFTKFHWDSRLFNDILGFTTWTLFGQLSTVGRYQAVTILLNQTFGPVVVAARSIAISVTSQINLFSSNFNLGLYPPIIKSYAANNIKEMFSLIFSGSKITFILMWIFALPMFLGMDAILQVWLKNPPIHAVLFTRLALVEALIHSISLPITTAARAPGKMKLYELTLGSIQIGIFLVSWVALALGAAAHAVFTIAIIANLLMFLVRLLIVRHLLALQLRQFSNEVLLPVLRVAILSASVSLVIHFSLPKAIAFALISSACSVPVSVVSMYYLGLTEAERIRVRALLMNRIARVVRA